MREAVAKAKVLLEALPYIQAFHDKVFVIKYGGSLLEDKNVRKSVLQDIVFMHYVGIKPVIVHGGGPSITNALKQKGIKVEFVDGLRRTDKRILKVVEKELLRLNRMIVEELKKMNCPAEGLSPSTAIIKAKQISPQLGFVGSVIGVNANPIFSLLNHDVIPVICPLGIDRKGQIYNVNADTSASEISVSLGAEKFVLMTNVEGIIYRGKLLSSANLKKIKILIDKKVITGGMLPKVEAGLNALDKGVKKVHIVNAKQSHALLLEIFTKRGVGTEIRVD